VRIHYGPTNRVIVFMVPFMNVFIENRQVQYSVRPIKQKIYY